MFDDLDKTMKEGRERWTKVEESTASIKEAMDTGNRVTPEEVAQLVFYVIDHLRPMNPNQDQLDEVTKGIAELLGSLKPKK